MFDLTGKIALVTGATRGIGQAIALGFAQNGADLIIIGRKVEARVKESIEAQGVKCQAYEYDLAQCAGLDDFIAKILRDCGRIDILCNCAGVQKRHPCADFPPEEWDYVNDVNSKAVFFLCQAVGKQMLERGYGKIINIASLLSFQGGLNVPAYAASKGAVMQFTKSLSNEWAGRGVNVNCIAPGFFDTDLNTALKADPVRSRQILERIPAGRWGQPQDAAGAAVFLASSASDYINGIILPVDGGWLGR